MMLTDANRHCCELMADSASRNELGCVKVQRLEFEQLDEIPNGHFDLIIGSDITYRLISQAALSTMVRVLLQNLAGSESGRSPRCVFSCENRRSPDVLPKDGEDWYVNDYATQKFVETAAEQGLCVSPLVIEPPGEVTSNSVSIFEVKLV